MIYTQRYTCTSAYPHDCSILPVRLLCQLQREPLSCVLDGRCMRVRQAKRWRYTCTRRKTERDTDRHGGKGQHRERLTCRNSDNDFEVAFLAGGASKDAVVFDAADAVHLHELPYDGRLCFREPTRHIRPP